jgi:hypothetical protein
MTGNQLIFPAPVLVFIIAEHPAVRDTPLGALSHVWITFLGRAIASTFAEARSCQACKAEMDIPADLRLCVSRRAGGLAATTQATPHFSTCEQRINSEDVPLTTSMQRRGVASPSSIFHPKYRVDPSQSLLPLITRYLDRERSGVVGKEHFRELLGQLGQREAEVKELWRASEAAAEYGGTDRKAEASNRPVGVQLRTFGRMLSSTRDRTVSGEFVLCLVQYVLSK